MALSNPGFLRSLHERSSGDAGRISRVPKSKHSSLIHKLSSLELGGNRPIPENVPNPQIFRSLPDDYTLKYTPELESDAPPAFSPDAGPSADPPPAYFSDTPLPTVAECAVHLELLLCIATLRRAVSQSRALDRALTIVPRPRTVTRRGKRVQIRDLTYEDRRKGKWPIYLNLAVARFLVWIRAVDGRLAQGRSVADIRLFPPPLDILMVWHSFLLNPVSYQQFCEEKQLYHITQIMFPWKAIHDAINPNTYSFRPHLEARERFVELTGLDIDLTDAIFHHSRHYKVATSLAALKDQPYLHFVTTEEVHRSKHVKTKSMTREAEAFLKICTESSKKQIVKVLADNVDRQYGFVQKMEMQLWLRSPALQGTLARARIRYERFLKLFKWYPQQMLVPTLDIDLLWHTHQLSHQQYIDTTKKLCGKFINHNDTIAKVSLDDGMKKTAELYRMRFGQDYAICNCWDCETILSGLEDAALHEGAVLNMEVLVRNVKRDVTNYRECEVVRRSGYVPKTGSH